MSLHFSKICLNGIFSFCTLMLWFNVDEFINFAASATKAKYEGDAVAMLMLITNVNKGSECKVIIKFYFDFMIPFLSNKMDGFHFLQYFCKLINFLQLKSSTITATVILKPSLHKQQWEAWAGVSEIMSPFNFYTFLAACSFNCLIW